MMGGEVRASFPEMKKLKEQEENGAWEEGVGGSMPSLKHWDSLAQF